METLVQLLRAAPRGQELRANLAPLADYKCSICALHSALARSEAGLGEDRFDAALGYVGGGAALSKTDLASPAPAAPRPARGWPPSPSVTTGC
eukprot:690207-Pyramimonas_sp.AAC.2